jgi:D-beta-D-heptose 7-phosphate kinase/D-beta-D-heptose 1-phosphate adenosyltransferase
MVTNSSGATSPTVRALAGLASVRVLVVGDIMLDRFVHGDVRRISPEAPVPVLRVAQQSDVPGGAGNVARNVAALGATAILVAVVGDDAEGAGLIDLVGSTRGIEPHLVVAPGQPTSLKTRYMAGGQQMLRADRETTAPIDDALATAVLDRAEAALAACDAVVLSDYAKGVLGADLTARLLAAAARASRPVVVDPKATDLSRYRGAAVLTPNRGELAKSAGHALDGDDAVVDAARVALRQIGGRAVLVTRGAEGMTLVTAEDAVHLPARSREVFDVAGAGDTVIAAFAAALGAGSDLVAAARLANAAAGIVVGKIGTAVVHPDELRHALDAADAAKVVGLDAARDRVALWRRRGERVVFTNGCFDLLHPGHVSLLDQARAAGDRLVVGLNADASVTRLKGAGRPVQGEEARARVLASLTAVDLVVIFAEDTPLALLEALRPDVLVKGADYRRDQVVGADQVESWGGRVVLADIMPGHSTTATIARLVR